MKKIKHIDIAPDLNDVLVGIIFEDDSKLSVTIKVSDQPFVAARVTSDGILAAVEEQLGLPNGLLAGSLVQKFCEEANRVLDGDRKYRVTGDHPTLARPDKSNLTDSQARQDIFELETMGYENIKVEQQKAA
jgi:hypothetical protein